MEKSVDELWKELVKFRTDSFRNYRKEFVFMPKKKFEPFKKYFNSSKNMMNKHINYRSKHAIRHIHAREADGMIDVHIDVGNTDSSPFLGIIHFILDILPYEIFCLERIGKLNSGMIYSELKEFRKKSRRL